MKLRPNANTTYETAREWYDSYGWHLTTDQGDIILQVVDYDWLDDEDDSAARARLMEDQDIARDEADEIIAQARSVREMAEEVEGLLAEAVEAYRSGDLDRTIEALEAADRRESAAGDSPATQHLRRALIEDR